MVDSVGIENQENYNDTWYIEFLKNNLGKGFYLLGFHSRLFTLEDVEVYKSVWRENAVFLVRLEDGTVGALTLESFERANRFEYIAALIESENMYIVKE